MKHRRWRHKSSKEVVIPVSERIEGISRKGPGEISKNLIEEYQMDL